MWIYYEKGRVKILYLVLDRRLFHYWREKRNQIQSIMSTMNEKENSLYELYQSLEELMNEMDFLISDRTRLANAVTSLKDDQQILELLEKQDQYIPEQENQYDEKKENKYSHEEKEDLVDKTESSKEQTQEVADGEQLDHVTANKYETVIQLRDQGYSEEEIARDLMIGIGEVRLILGFKTEKKWG